MKRFLICLLAAIMGLGSFVACNKKEPTEITVEGTKISYTDIELCGNSNYSVILSETADDIEQYACKEFVKYYSEATDVSLDIKYAENIDYNENGSYFSIGENSFQKASGVVAAYEQYGRDGFKIVTKGNSVVLIGGGSYGTLYAVYEFLHQNFGFEPYAPDEIKLNTFTSVKLVDFDFSDKPAFEDRCGGYYVAAKDAEFAAKWRTFAGWGQYTLESYENNIGGEDPSIWGSWGHSSFGYCNPKDYYAVHKDWYSEKTNGKGEPCQLCYTNTEMAREFLKNLKERILLYKEKEYFMIGLNDYIDCYCTCSNCQSRMAEVGYGGIIVEFFNYLGREIKAWQTEIGDMRDILLVILGYYEWETPPVKEVNGEFVPLEEGLRCEDNVGVMIAPIYSDFGKEYLDETYNARARKSFLGWNAICDNLMVWSYSTNFNLCFEWFDNYDVLQKNYQMFRDLGLKLVFDECGGEWQQSNSFQIMTGYVNSKLFWNPDLDSEALRDDFMQNYYKIAYPYISEYYQQMRIYFAKRKQEIFEQSGKRATTAIMTERGEQSLNKDFWNVAFLNRMEELFEKAYDAIEESDYTDLEKEKLYNRVLTESLTIRYLQLELFASEYTQDAYLEKISLFSNDVENLKIGLIELTKTNQAVYDEWRANII